ncbi:MAG: GH32 C-terminal domain-containing protein [Verrucomicrobia bacterium]|nr:GH32 C-terminal domain-containing protein [Verrucomicrobiota bacterium]
MKHAVSMFAVFVGVALVGRALAAEGGDILINDFEGSGWGDWKTEGQAFGAGPWHPGGDNPRVFGYEGRGLAAGRNAPNGSLSSPEFSIERDYINLKVGGGWYPGRTCVNLLIDGKVIHSQYGLGTGFGEQHEDYVLQWFTWDVRPYRGQKARIQVVDNFDYNSGFILVDHLVQSDTRKAEPVDRTPMRETYRPQFHFTAEKGWLSDPCGLFYYKGIYHLIYQHAGRDELSVLFSPTAWGHAVSTDLLHWRQLPDAIRCEEDFDWSGYSCAGVASVEGKPSGFIMSGSSVIDLNNDSGLKMGDHPPILSFYNHYATQTWFDGQRHIQIAWMAKGFALPDMPFNQQMTFPRLLELKSTPDGPRLFKTPVREIESLRAKSHTRRDLELTPGTGNPLAGIAGDLLDVAIDFEPGDAQRIELSVRGTPIVYNVAEKQLHCLASTMPLEPINGHVKLRLLVDRTSVEVFGNDGRATMSNYFMPPKDNTSLALAAIGGRCKVVLAEVHELRSATVKGTE